ncbi:hypothetical protein MHK_003021 [Candidatus Magnetomorum sp. HK-1]|nr:hypothetical protein MHK_003021 [Candidatus Magnetomorum sp. HK-1]
MKNYQKPRRTFEKSGLVIPDQSFHVYLENVTNTDNENIQTMVDKGRYFTIFAPIEDDPYYIAILLSFQTYQNLSDSEFYKIINKNIKKQITDRLKTLNCKELDDVTQCFHEFPIVSHTSFYDLFEMLNDIIHQKKIIIFIDEFDGIPISELENFLMVLRDLYQNYKHTQKGLLFYSISRLCFIRCLNKAA